MQHTKHKAEICGLPQLACRAMHTVQHRLLSVAFPYVNHSGQTALPMCKGCFLHWAVWHCAYMAVGCFNDSRDGTWAVKKNVTNPCPTMLWWVQLHMSMLGGCLVSLGCEEEDPSNEEEYHQSMSSWAPVGTAAFSCWTCKSACDTVRGQICSRQKLWCTLGHRRMCRMHVVTLAQHCSRQKVKTVSYHTVTMVCCELIYEQPRSLQKSYQGRGKKAYCTKIFLALFSSSFSPFFIVAQFFVLSSEQLWSPVSKLDWPYWMLPDTGSFMILEAPSTAVAISPQVAHLQWKHNLMTRSARTCGLYSLK